MGITRLFFSILFASMLVGCAAAQPSAAPTSSPSPAPTETLLGGVFSDLPYGSQAVDQRMTLHLPEGRSPQTPVLFFPYGRYFTQFLEYFTQRGYAIAAVDVRNTTFQEEMADTFCALAFLHTQAEDYGIDPHRIVAVGGSMGGGSAALLAGIDDPAVYMENCDYSLPNSGRVAGVITMAGVFDYTLEEDFFTGFYDNIRVYMGGTLEENPATWAEASAVNHIDGSEPPFLLLHGEGDINVDQHQSLLFAAVLEQAGVLVDLELIPRLDHLGVTQSRQSFILVEDFLNRYLGEPGDG